MRRPAPPARTNYTWQSENAAAGGARPQVSGGGVNSPANMARRKFTPFQTPDTPPAGTFDPMLESQRAAASRGLGDLKYDVGLQQGRSLSDYMVAMNHLGVQRDRQTQDIQRQQQYATQDYQRSTGLLQRRFGFLGQSQAAQQVAAGEGLGGAVQASAQARAANQRIEQQGLDIPYGREQAAGQLQQQRLGQNYDYSAGQMGLQYNRGVQDLNTQLSRASRENTFFGNDISQEENYQAGFMGYVPPQAPANEQTRAGMTYQQLPNAGGAVLPSGAQVGQSQLYQMLGQRGYYPNNYVYGSDAVNG